MIYVLSQLFEFTISKFAYEIRIIIELISGSIIINIKILKKIYNNQNTYLYTFILIVFLFLYIKNDIINIFYKTKKNVINVIDIFNKKNKNKYKPLG